MRNYKKSGIFWRMSCVLVVSLGLLGCINETRELDPPGPTPVPISFECSADTAGWAECYGGRVVWCRGVGGLDPMFMMGDRCKSSGLVCIDSADHQAACTNEAACNPRCDEDGANIAYGCLQNQETVEYCGWYQKCRVRNSMAYCDVGDQLLSSLDDDGMVQYDPEYVCDAYSNRKGPYFTSLADTVGDSVDYEVRLNTPVTVTLAADGEEGDEGFLRFYTDLDYAGDDRSGRYVILLDKKELFDRLVPVAGGSSNTTSGDLELSCATELVEQHETTGNLNPGAYAIELSNGTDSAVTVTLLVTRVTSAEEVDCEAVTYKESYLVTALGEPEEGEDELEGGDYVGGSIRAPFDIPITLTIPAGTSYINFAVDFPKDVTEAIVGIWLTEANLVAGLRHINVIPPPTPLDDVSYTWGDETLVEGPDHGECPALLVEGQIAKLSPDADYDRYFVLEFDNEGEEEVTLTLLLRILGF